MSMKRVPFTTRPPSTSMHGITRLKCIRSSLAVERRLRLGDRESPLVQRLADDDARQVDLAQRAQGAQVLEGPDAAGVEEAAAHGRGDPGDVLERGPLERAVAVGV